MHKRCVYNEWQSIYDISAATLVPCLSAVSARLPVSFSAVCAVCASKTCRTPCLTNLQLPHFDQHLVLMQHSRTHLHLLQGIFGKGPVISPKALAIQLSNTTSPMTVNVVPSLIQSSTGIATITSVNSLYPNAVTAVTSMNKTDIILTLVNPDLLPNKVPVIVVYTVQDSAGSSPGLLKVTSPPSKPPVGPESPVTVGPAYLGIPLTVNASTLLQGWTDLDGHSFGIIAAYVMVRS